MDLFEFARICPKARAEGGNLGALSPRCRGSQASSVVFLNAVAGAANKISSLIAAADRALQPLALMIDYSVAL